MVSALLPPMRPMTSRAGPWTPIVSWFSMSAVRLGPVTRETCGPGTPGPAEVVGDNAGQGFEVGHDLPFARGGKRRRAAASRRAFPRRRNPDGRGSRFRPRRNPRGRPPAWAAAMSSVSSGSPTASPAVVRGRPGGSARRRPCGSFPSSKRRGRRGQGVVDVRTRKTSAPAARAPAMKWSARSALHHFRAFAGSIFRRSRPRSTAPIR